MGTAQWVDVGMFMQSIMLLAREHGLHTCPREAWSGWYQEVAARDRPAPRAHAVFRYTRWAIRMSRRPSIGCAPTACPWRSFASFRGFE